VHSCHDSRAAPQIAQTASPVCGTKNFSSVRLYSAPQVHCTIVTIPVICASDHGISSPGNFRCSLASWPSLCCRGRVDGRREHHDGLSALRLRGQLRTSVTRQELQRVCPRHPRRVGQSRHQLGELCAADPGQQAGRISARSEFGTKCLAATWLGETVARRQPNGACRG